jgi:hypothetical protein
VKVTHHPSSGRPRASLSSRRETAEIDSAGIPAVAIKGVVDTYEAHTAGVLEVSKRGERPPESELEAETGLLQLARVHRELPDALASFYRPTN